MSGIRPTTQLPILISLNPGAGGLELALVFLLVAVVALHVFKHSVRGAGIYEVFKGTGNSEVHLDRRIAEKRVYPAINVNASGTRREDYLIEPELLQKIWILRKLLHPMDELAAMEFLLDKMKSTKSNDEFFGSMKR